MERPAGGVAGAGRRGQRALRGLPHRPAHVGPARPGLAPPAGGCFSAGSPRVQGFALSTPPGFGPP